MTFAGEAQIDSKVHTNTKEDWSTAYCTSVTNPCIKIPIYNIYILFKHILYRKYKQITRAKVQSGSPVKQKYESNAAWQICLNPTTTTQRVRLLKFQSYLCILLAYM